MARQKTAQIVENRLPRQTKPKTFEGDHRVVLKAPEDWEVVEDALEAAYTSSTLLLRALHFIRSKNAKVHAQDSLSHDIMWFQIYFRRHCIQDTSPKSEPDCVSLEYYWSKTIDSFSQSFQHSLWTTFLRFPLCPSVARRFQIFVAIVKVLRLQNEKNSSVERREVEYAAETTPHQDDVANNSCVSCVSEVKQANNTNERTIHQHTNTCEIHSLPERNTTSNTMLFRNFIFPQMAEISNQFDLESRLHHVGYTFAFFPRVYAQHIVSNILHLLHGISLLETNSTTRPFPRPGPPSVPRSEFQPGITVSHFVDLYGALGACEFLLPGNLDFISTLLYTTTKSFISMVRHEAVRDQENDAMLSSLLPENDVLAARISQVFLPEKAEDFSLSSTRSSSSPYILVELEVCLLDGDILDDDSENDQITKPTRLLIPMRGDLFVSLLNTITPSLGITTSTSSINTSCSFEEEHSCKESVSILDDIRQEIERSWETVSFESSLFSHFLCPLSEVERRKDTRIEVGDIVKKPLGIGKDGNNKFSSHIILQVENPLEHLLHTDSQDTQNLDSLFWCGHFLQNVVLESLESIFGLSLVSQNEALEYRNRVAMIVFRSKLPNVLKTNTKGEGDSVIFSFSLLHCKCHNGFVKRCVSLEKKLSRNLWTDSFEESTNDLNDATTYDSFEENEQSDKNDQNGENSPQILSRSSSRRYSLERKFSEENHGLTILMMYASRFLSQRNFLEANHSASLSAFRHSISSMSIVSVSLPHLCEMATSVEIISDTSYCEAVSDDHYQVNSHVQASQMAFRVHSLTYYTPSFLLSFPSNFTLDVPLDTFLFRAVMSIRNVVLFAQCNKVGLIQRAKSLAELHSPCIHPFLLSPEKKKLSGFQSLPSSHSDTSIFRMFVRHLEGKKSATLNESWGDTTTSGEDIPKVRKVMQRFSQPSDDLPRLWKGNDSSEAEFLLLSSTLLENSHGSRDYRSVDESEDDSVDESEDESDNDEEDEDDSNDNGDGVEDEDEDEDEDEQQSEEDHNNVRNIQDINSNKQPLSSYSFSNNVVDDASRPNSLSIATDTDMSALELETCLDLPNAPNNTQNLYSTDVETEANSPISNIYEIDSFRARIPSLSTIMSDSILKSSHTDTPLFASVVFGLNLLFQCLLANPSLFSIKTLFFRDFGPKSGNFGDVDVDVNITISGNVRLRTGMTATNNYIEKNGNYDTDRHSPGNLAWTSMNYRDTEKAALSSMYLFQCLLMPKEGILRAFLKDKNERTGVFLLFNAMSRAENDFMNSTNQEISTSSLETRLTELFQLQFSKIGKEISSLVMNAFKAQNCQDNPTQRSGVFTTQISCLLEILVVYQELTQLSLFLQIMGKKEYKNSSQDSSLDIPFCTKLVILFLSTACTFLRRRRLFFEQAEDKNRSEKRITIDEDTTVDANLALSLVELEITGIYLGAKRFCVEECIENCALTCRFHDIDNIVRVGDPSQLPQQTLVTTNSGLHLFRVLEDHFTNLVETLQNSSVGPFSNINVE